MSAASSPHSWRAGAAAALAGIAFFAAALAIDRHVLRPEALKDYVLLAAGALAVLVGFPEIRRSLARLPQFTRWALVAPVAAFALSAWAAGRPLPALHEASQLSLLLLLTLQVAGMTRGTREGLLLAAAIGGGLVSVLGLGERAGLISGLSSNGTPHEPASTFGNVAFASELVLASVWLATRFAYRAASTPKRIAWCALHLLGVLYLAVAGTTTAFLVYAAVGLLAWAACWRRDPARARLFLPVLAVGLALFLLPLAAAPPAPPPPGDAQAAAPLAQTAERSGPSDFRTFEVRWLTWGAVLAKLFPEHAVLGIGGGSFDELFPPYRSAEERNLSRRAEGPTIVNGAHNDALQLLSENGLLGIAALLLTLVLLVRATRGGSAPERVWLWAVLIAIALNGLARTPLTTNAPVGALAAFTLGALLARGGRMRALSSAPSVLVPLGLLVFAVAMGGWLGATRARASIRIARVIADLPEQGVVLEDDLRRTLISRLDEALLLAPEDYRARLLRARLTSDGAAALEQVDFALEHAPYDLSALALKGELWYRSAGLLENPVPALQGSLQAQLALLDLDPDEVGAKANAALCRMQLARYASDPAQALYHAGLHLALRPRSAKELAPLLADLREQAARVAIAAGRYEEAAQWLDQDAMARDNDDKILAFVESLAEQGNLTAARAIAEAAIPGPDNRERCDALADRLFELSSQAWEDERFRLMKEGLEASVLLSFERAAREKRIGTKLNVRVATSNGEKQRIAKLYGQKFTIQSHETKLLDAVSGNDAAGAAEALRSLAKYPAYREEPIAPIDEAVVAVLQGRNQEAARSFDRALEAGLTNLGHRRDRLYRAVFLRDAALAGRLSRVAPVETEGRRRY